GRSTPTPRPSHQSVRPRLPPNSSLESKQESPVNLCPRALVKTLKASGSIPDDAFMTYGNTYVRKVCCN
ncbi:hypothetical protein EET67_03070, partial [Pseudaminobacter arsenicus]